MANSLAAFMAENAVKVEVVRTVASKRFVDSDGNPVEWQIGAITSDEDEELRKSCTKKIYGKKNSAKYTIETDFEGYVGKLAARCTVFPDLSNAELQDSYGVTSADKLLKTMLLPGEYTEYCRKVQGANGFDITMDDLVEEAKN